MTDSIQTAIHGMPNKLLKYDQKIFWVCDARILYEIFEMVYRDTNGRRNSKKKSEGKHCPVDSETQDATSLQLTFSPVCLRQTSFLWQNLSPGLQHRDLPWSARKEWLLYSWTWCIKIKLLIKIPEGGEQPPQLITFYKTKGGVDTMVQMAHLPF